MTASDHTFLFTDIAGSTQLLRALGEAYEQALAEHRRILRRVFADHRGDEFGGNEGDAFFVAFRDPGDAVAAAVAAQTALAAHEWPQAASLEVRIGIHTGPATVSASGFVGMALHETARINGAAHGGQVVVSGAVADALGAPPAGVELRDLGEHQLKDVPEPLRVLQVCHPQLRADFPPVRVSQADTAAAPVADGRVRVLLVDDQEMIRAGFRMILESKGFHVVGEAGDGAEAVAAVGRLRPDVVLMDIRMPTMDGIEATRRIAGPEALAPVKVLVLTTFDLDEYVYRALQAGASGFLLKDAPPADLVRAIEVVAGGDALLAPSITRRLVEEFASRPARVKADDPRLATLTEREREVLQLVAQGLSNAEVGTRLFLGEATVKTHMSNVLMKLGVRDRVQAVVAAYETGLVQPGQHSAG